MRAKYGIPDAGDVLVDLLSARGLESRVSKLAARGLGWLARELESAVRPHL
jgi:hypothetical protein